MTITRHGHADSEETGAARSGARARTVLGELAQALAAPTDAESNEPIDVDLRETEAQRGAARRAFLRARGGTAVPRSSTTATAGQPSHVRLTNGRRAQTAPARAAVAPPTGAPPRPARPVTAPVRSSAAAAQTETRSEAPRRRRPRTSAGRCLAVGLVCFAIWLLFDANQLYVNANAQPTGARRTVSMILLRPIAAVANTLGLSGIVSGANDALNKSGVGFGNGGSPNVSNPMCDIGGVLQPCTGGYPTGPGPHGGQGSVYAVMPPLPHHVVGERFPQPPPPTGPHHPHVPQLPGLAQPSAKHQLVMLNIGDSLGVDLGYGLGDQYGPDPWVNLIQKSRIDTSLSLPNYYDWPANLEQFLHQYHPHVVVVMIGGNDTHGLVQNNQSVGFGTPTWRIDYAERVQQIMDEVTATGARVFWVGEPIMQSAGLSQQMLQVNGVAAHVAAITPGATYFSSWNLFAVHGQYSEYIPGPSGGEIDARYPDGTHIAPGGYDYLALKMVKPMEQAWRIKLGPNF